LALSADILQRWQWIRHLLRLNGLDDARKQLLLECVLEVEVVVGLCRDGLELVQQLVHLGCDISDGLWLVGHDVHLSADFLGIFLGELVIGLVVSQIVKNFPLAFGKCGVFILLTLSGNIECLLNQWLVDLVSQISSRLIFLGRVVRGGPGIFRLPSQEFVELTNDALTRTASKVTYIRNECLGISAHADVVLLNVDSFALDLVQFFNSPVTQGNFVVDLAF
jgi:hypothetical protein